MSDSSSDDRFSVDSDIADLLCSKCEIGEALGSNVIVQCSGPCKGADHVNCHPKPIPQEAIDNVEYAWYCYLCE